MSALLLFPRRLINRLQMPTKHILVIEDVLVHQSDIADHFAKIFPHEGLVQVSYVSGCNAAAGVIERAQVDLIILDANTPDGDAFSFLPWRAAMCPEIPVITFSGIPQNNDWMKQNGSEYKFLKHEVIEGKTDELIKRLLELKN